MIIFHVTVETPIISKTIVCSRGVLMTTHDDTWTLHDNTWRVGAIGAQVFFTYVWITCRTPQNPWFENAQFGRFFGGFWSGNRSRVQTCSILSGRGLRQSKNRQNFLQALCWSCRDPKRQKRCLFESLRQTTLGKYKKNKLSVHFRHSPMPFDCKTKKSVEHHKTLFHGVGRVDDTNLKRLMTLDSTSKLVSEMTPSGESKFAVLWRFVRSSGSQNLGLWVTLFETFIRTQSGQSAEAEPKNSPNFYLDRDQWSQCTFWGPIPAQCPAWHLICIS
jgi:hypothetical protein